MRDELKKEKEVNQKLREELKSVEIERLRIIKQIQQVEGFSQQVQNESSDKTYKFKSKEVSFNALEHEYR